MNTLDHIEKPSELLKLVLHDCELADRDPNCGWDMNWWHSKRDSRCVVCLAGAVMKYSLTDECCEPEDFPHGTTAAKLYFIDGLRSPNSSFVEARYEKAFPKAHPKMTLFLMRQIILESKPEKYDFLRYDSYMKRYLQNLITAFEREGL